MKKRLRFILIITSVFIASIAFTQGPPDPDPDPTGGDNDIGGGAPLDGSTGFLLLLGSMYVSRKIRGMKS